MDSRFHLKVVSKEGIIFDGEVSSISSFNAKGKFDVLESHTNFISLIKDKLVLRENNDAVEKELKFITALLRVRQNNVEVYIGVEGLGKS